MNRKERAALRRQGRTLRVSLMLCEAICMLPCWQDSKGATIERSIAKSVGLPVLYLSNPLPVEA